jgi:hypothetical protein
MENPEIIKMTDKLAHTLIQVHINKARTKEYYYGWSSDLKGWERMGKVPKGMYDNPAPRTTYKR